MVEISVVMPLRNTPKDVLQECLDSLNNQIMKDFELICVNDASDHLDTIALLNDFENIHKYMRVINLDTPHGAAYARNVGLENAKGKYVVFLDSDDIFVPEMLEALFTKAEKENSEVCICGFSNFEVVEGRRKIIGKMTLDGDYDRTEYEEFLYKVTTSPCNKLCRLDYIRREEISFQTLTSDNDVFYALMVVLCTEKISYIQDSDFLHYRNNTHFQISNNINPYNLLCAIEKTKMEIRHRQCYQKYMDCLIDSYFVLTGCAEMKRCRNKELARGFYEHCVRSGIIANLCECKGKAQKYLELWKMNPHDMEWIYLVSDYDLQLNSNREILLREVACNELGCYVWGRGKRGTAFLKFARDNHVIIKGFYDRAQGNNVRTDSGVPPFVTADVILDSDLPIVASNHDIYMFLLKSAKKGRYIIDLEKYCPL